MCVVCLGWPVGPATLPPHSFNCRASSGRLLRYNTWIFFLPRLREILLLGAYKFFVSNGPGSEDLVLQERMPANFEPQHSNRIASIDPSQRHKMAERYYQMLVSREHGSTVVTQFIGNIPLSKAEPHRHLYEEALIFLNGEGVVWTEGTRTPVAAGDVLFLPRKQVHSVQCTTPGGFDIVGVIYPGDNPSINY